MLVVRSNGVLEDRQVLDLPDLLDPKDLLIFNDTRVLPAALSGVRPARDVAGQDVEVAANLVEELSDSDWVSLARPGRRLKPGDKISFGDGFSAQVHEKRDGGETVLRFNLRGSDLKAAFDRFGAMPLPPYIARRRAADDGDRGTYQTTFAKGEAKSVAAPTAGLHFTPRLLDRFQSAGISSDQVRLHVGLGTFAPLKDEQIDAARLHAEWRDVSAETANHINAVRESGGRCVGVGTTALRTLESSADPNGRVVASRGETDIFIQPGYQFRALDALITNFHLPRSSLFMLVCALMGTDVMQHAYAHAVASQYRFYSYGDACLLLP